MRDTTDRPAAPNYTAACIVMFGINLTWMLFVIWAVWGLIAVLATGWAVNRTISYVDVQRRN
ncbi:MAG: hypothetical protein WBB25_02045 [Sulfitobacter sp.]